MRGAAEATPPGELREHLDAVYRVLRRGALWQLPRSLPRSTGRERWEERAAAMLQELFGAEQQLAIEVEELARAEGVVLHDSEAPLEYSSANFLVLDQALRLVHRRGEAETEALVAAKEATRRDPRLGPIFADLLSRRRGHLRRIAGLLSRLEGTAGRAR